MSTAHGPRTVAAKRQCRAYRDYRELLDAKDVDAVFVATPDHWHVLPSIHACQAGKDVYLEKPLSLTIREGRVLVDAVRKYGRVLQTGSQRRSMSGHRWGCELVRNGVAGKIHTVIIMNYPSPWECRFPGQPVPDGLDWDAWCGHDRAGAVSRRHLHPALQPGLDLLAALLRRRNDRHRSPRLRSDPVGSGSGPHRARSRSGPKAASWHPVVYTQPESRGRGDRLCSRGRRVRMRYANGIEIRLEDNGAGGRRRVHRRPRQDPHRQQHGRQQSRGSGQDPPGEPARSACRVIDDHIQNWFDCIKSRQKPIADVEIGHRSAILCHLGNIVRWVGRPLRWDPGAGDLPRRRRSQRLFVAPDAGPVPTAGADLMEFAKGDRGNTVRHRLWQVSASSTLAVESLRKLATEALSARIVDPRRLTASASGSLALSPCQPSILNLPTASVGDHPPPRRHLVRGQRT